MKLIRSAVTSVLLAIVLHTSHLNVVGLGLNNILGVDLSALTNKVLGDDGKVTDMAASLTSILSGPISSLSLPSLLSLTPTLEQLAKVDKNLLSVLENSGKSDVIVDFGGTRNVLNEIRSQQFASTTAGRGALVKALQRNAEKKQALAKSLFSVLSLDDCESFWVANVAVVPNCGLAAVRLLSMLNDVTGISSAPTIKLDPLVSPFVAFQNAANSKKSVQWGLETIHAPEVWKKGVTGQGVVVANIDSGVRGTHEALHDSMRKERNWFDPATGTSSPTDENGHGTHTMGTICGSKGVGVAPGAQWIACRGCTSSSCPSPALLSCGQWIMAPTDSNGKNPSPSHAPDIVSNSWGSPTGGDKWYDSIVDAWTAANIYHCFANGNLGPLCVSSGSPGDRPNVLSVGATTSDGQLASFSSKGPSIVNILEIFIKPDISAPGKDVYSCWNSADNHYNTISGTSMATPHVAGAMALMLSAYRSATNDPHAKIPFEDIVKIMRETADTTNIKKSATGACDLKVVGNHVFPNNQFGFGNLKSGQVDALRCVSSVLTNHQ